MSSGASTPRPGDVAPLYHCSLDLPVVLIVRLDALVKRGRKALR